MRAHALLIATLLWAPLTADTQEDTTPPALLELVVNTPVVDTTASAATVRVTLRVGDDLAGVASVGSLILNSTTPGQASVFGPDCRFSTGNAFNAIYDCSLVLGRFSRFDTYTVFIANVRDAANNATNFTTDATVTNTDLGGRPDFDNDGTPDDFDNCPETPNPGQEDRDLDRIGDACDPFPEDPPVELPDGDSDGVADVFDNCPADANAEQADIDGDRVGDACDNCTPLPNHDQSDLDGNQTGDLCDAALALFGGAGDVTQEDLAALESIASDALAIAAQAISEQQALADAVAQLEARLQALEDASAPDGVGVRAELERLKRRVTMQERRIKRLEQLPAVKDMLRRHGRGWWRYWRGGRGEGEAEEAAR